MSARYAVFFCPDDASDLASYGRLVLGRTADGSPANPSHHDFHDRTVAAALSATPAHYGFHATLKAPFRLSVDASEEDLLSAVESLAQRQTSIDMHSLKPMMLSEFVALGFERQPSAVARLASQCVEQFESLRAPLTQEDLHKRKPDLLNDAQRAYLFQYGYPYVMSEFCFHMTLTGRLTLDEHADYVDWLKTLYTRIVPQEPKLDRLAVYWQPDRAAAFTRLAQFPIA